MHVSKEKAQNILWWKHNIIGIYAPIVRKNPSVVINTDASSFGWGTSLGENKTGGQFSTEEIQQIINSLQLKAAKFYLRALCKNKFNSYIFIHIYNTSVVSAFNKMASVKSIEADNELHFIREFIITQKYWLTATHIPGVFNEDADRKSRNLNLRTGWMLNRSDFQYITKNLMSLHQ